MENLINAIVTVEAVINRADGTSEPLGTVGYYDPNHPEDNIGDLQITEFEGE